MNIRHLRTIPGRNSARSAALMLTLALTVSCSTSQTEPSAAIAPASTATQTAETATSETATAAPDTTSVSSTSVNSPPNSPPTDQAENAEPQGEPGYIGYPSMGETADGDYIYYVSSQPVDCGPDAACLSVQFVQADGANLNMSMNGTAVANCTRRILSEVLLDGDLVAYEIASPDAAMTELISTACQAWSPGEPGAGVPTVPDGLTTGMGYSEVRSQLAEAGWIAKDVRMETYTSLEQQMYDKGYTEVLGCSGQGQCRFEFDYYLEGRLPSDEALVVITRFSDDDPFFEADPVLDSASIQGSFAEDI